MQEYEALLLDDCSNSILFHSSNSAPSVFFHRCPILSSDLSAILPCLFYLQVHGWFPLCIYRKPALFEFVLSLLDSRYTVQIFGVLGVCFSAFLCYWRLLQISTHNVSPMAQAAAIPENETNFHFGTTWCPGLVGICCHVGDNDVFCGNIAQCCARLELWILLLFCGWAWIGRARDYQSLL